MVLIADQSASGVPDSRQSKTNIPYPGSTHTKGSYVELYSSTSHDACGLDLLGKCNTNKCLIDIAIGATGSEVNIVENLSLRTTTMHGMHHLPIRIPAGSRVSARMQIASSSNTLDLYPHIIYGSGGYQWCETFGANLSLSEGTLPGATGSGQSAWVTFGTTTKSARALMVVSSSFKDTLMFWEVGVDDGAAKHSIAGSYVYEDGDANQPIPERITHPVDVAAGQELFMRTYNDAAGEFPRATIHTFG